MDLSYSMWDLVPWLGIKPRPPALEAWSLSHWTTREVPYFLMYFHIDVHLDFSLIKDAIVANPYTYTCWSIFMVLWKVFSFKSLIFFTFFFFFAFGSLIYLEGVLLSDMKGKFLNLLELQLCCVSHKNNSVTLTGLLHGLYWIPGDLAPHMAHSGYVYSLPFLLTWPANSYSSWVCL